MPSSDEPDHHRVARAIVEAAERTNLGLTITADGQDRLVNRTARQYLGGCAPPEGVACDDADSITASAFVRDLRANARFLLDAGDRTVVARAGARFEARFRRVLDAAPVAIAIGTRDRFMYANPALARLLHRQSTEAVTRIPLREHLHEKDRSRAHELFEAALSTGQPQPCAMLRLLRSDGETVPIELNVLTTEWRGELAVLGLARDVSERLRTQDRLLRADRLAAVGTLAAGVAHEINNPLSYVLLNLQYLMRELPRFDGSAKNVERFLERLHEAQHGAERVRSIVTNLQAFSHPEREEHGPVSVVEAMRAAVKVATNAIRPRAKLREVYATKAVVEASSARLEQVFVNLLVNAAQALPEGEPGRHEVVAYVETKGDQVIVEVTDDGPGIERELLTKIFDPFFSTKPRGTGTGLGLPICHSIISSLGGEIAVRSEPGMGTTFRITLPACTKPIERPMRASSAPPTARVRRRHVLVIDDEPLVADMLQRTLSEHHDVTIATNAKEALERMLAEPFDVVFCDLLMPGMNGMDLYEDLSQRRPGLERRIVFMTGGAFTQRATQFLSTVPNPRIQKPFDLEELHRIVSRFAI